MIFEPKLIELRNSFAVTGERMLCFVPKDDDSSVLDETSQRVKESFKTPPSFGLPFRADANTLSVTLIPTLACNMNCSYCYSDGGLHSSSLSVKFAKTAFDALTKRYDQANRINLFFAGGGEPLLNFELVREITGYVSKKMSLNQLRIVTNGTLVLPNLSWLRKRKTYIRISYDGSSQNTTRPGCGFDSSKAVKQTLKILSSEYPLDYLSIQITVTKENVSKVARDVFDLATEYGIQTFKIEPVQTSCSSRSASVSSPEISAFANCIMDTLTGLHKKNINAIVDTSYLSVPIPSTSVPYATRL